MYASLQGGGGIWYAGSGRDTADTGHAWPYLWARHEAGAESEAVPPGLCHAGYSSIIPSGEKNKRNYQQCTSMLFALRQMGAK